MGLQVRSRSVAASAAAGVTPASGSATALFSTRVPMLTAHALVMTRSSRHSCGRPAASPTAASSTPQAVSAVTGNWAAPRGKATVTLLSASIQACTLAAIPIR